MMKASDVMVPHVITVDPELDVKAVANTLAANGISAVPVIYTTRSSGSFQRATSRAKLHRALSVRNLRGRTGVRLKM